MLLDGTITINSKYHTIQTNLPDNDKNLNYFLTSLKLNAQSKKPTDIEIIFIENGLV